MEENKVHAASSKVERRAAIRRLLVQLPVRSGSTNRRFRRRQIAIVAVPALAATILLTAGAIAVTQANVTNRDEVMCAARAERNIWGAIPGTQAVLGAGSLGESDGGPIAISDPVSLCADLWAQHVLDAGTPSGTFAGPADGTFSYPVPELVECVMGNGAAAVVPGGPEVCQVLGLSEFGTGDN